VERLRYGWLKNVPKIARTHLLADFDAARGPVGVDKLVFAEVAVDPGLHLAAAGSGRDAVLVAGAFMAVRYDRPDQGGVIESVRARPRPTVGVEPPDQASTKRPFGANAAEGQRQSGTIRSVIACLPRVVFVTEATTRVPCEVASGHRRRSAVRGSRCPRCRHQW
jgi:predicted TIM-barrel fold metal-dependent hydrolase